MYWKFKMAERIFTDQEEFEISKNYLNGKSLRDLAKEKNSSVCAISGALRRQKTSTRSTTEATKIREYNETFDDIQKAKIVKLYKNGLSLFKIATSYSVAYGTIERVLKKKNIKIRSKKEADKLQSQFTKSQESDICSLYMGGYSTSIIGNFFKCSKTTINRILLRNKIILRTTKEAHLLKSIRAKAILWRKNEQRKKIPIKLKTNINKKNHRKKLVIYPQTKLIYIGEKIGILKLISVTNWEQLPLEERENNFKKPPKKEELFSEKKDIFCKTQCTKCGVFKYFSLAKLLELKENILKTDKEYLSCKNCELYKKFDLKEKEFGKWKALKHRRVPLKSKKSTKVEWLCLCLNCSKTKRWIDASYLKQMPEGRGCGCNTRQHRGLFRIIGRDVMTHYYSVRYRAKKYNLPFDMVPEDFVPPKKCPILGIPLIRNSGNQNNSPNSPSLDRFIPEKGYIKSNVHFISFKANRMKNDGTLDQWIKFGDWCEKQHNLKEKNSK